MLQIGDQIGPYRLIGRLGQGSFGSVWLAEKYSLVTTQFALKLPLDQNIRLVDMTREARLWVAVSDHPNVVKIFEAAVYDSQMVIVSEYASGGSLLDRLRREPERRLPIDQAIEITSGILEGLSHLHAKQIIHRDLKPANILLKSGVPLISDFGISTVLRSTGPAGTVAGTFPYMSPESFEGKRSEQTDLWSVAVILFQLLTGQLPFRADNQLALMKQIISAEPIIPAELPSRLNKLLWRALQKDPARRFRSALEMRESLKLARYQIDQQLLNSRTLSSQSNHATLVMPPTRLSDQPVNDNPVQSGAEISPDDWGQRKKRGLLKWVSDLIDDH